MPEDVTIVAPSSDEVTNESTVIQQSAESDEDIRRLSGNVQGVDSYSAGSSSDDPNIFDAGEDNTAVDDGGTGDVDEVEEVEPGAIEFMLEHEELDRLFFLGDEAFEAEHDRESGLGQGPMPGNLALPAPSLRVHEGERGGLDASSCRACHAAGGPDGAGTLSQVGLFRGDGRHLSSATVRAAPHVMGLGYLEIAAREISAQLDTQLAVHAIIAEAQETQEP
jgi:hypothetical protein